MTRGPDTPGLAAFWEYEVRGEVVDVTGQTFPPMRPRKIVSLVPSLTETVFAYGLGSSIVGLTRYCSEPAGLVERLPRVGGTKDPDLERIREIEPDLILASSEENRREDVESLISEGFKVFVTLPTSVPAALVMLIDLAHLLSGGIEADQITADLRVALDQAVEKVGCGAAVPYFCPIWRRPYMTSGPGTYVYDLLERCGGQSVCGRGEARYFPVELADVAQGHPSVILLPDEPYPFAERHKEEFSTFPAALNGGSPRAYCVDGKALTWYGPRSAAALRMFTDLLAGGLRASLAEPNL